MKKIVALLLCAVLLVSTMPVFAAQEDSQKMQEVLLIVKGKIEIPEALSEFSGDVYSYNQKETYQFEWSTPDYGEYISVSCDSKGRIEAYRTSRYDTAKKRISSVTKAEIIAFAENFLKKIAPEAFVNEKDSLVYNEEGYEVWGNLEYSVSFIREKDGVPVKNNNATVTIFVTDDDEITLRRATISFDYDTEFAPKSEDVSSYTEKYKELFPVEMIYRDEYNYDSKKNEPKLIYRIKDDKIGYMDSATGEIVLEDSSDRLYASGGAAEDSVSKNESLASPLTPQEKAELENIAGLISVEEIRNAVKQLPYVDFPDELVLTSHSLYKDSLGDYYYNLNYSNDSDDAYRHFGISANAKTGKILYISGNGAIPYRYSEEEIVLSDAQKQEASAKIAEFLNAVAKDELASSKMKTGEASRYNYSENYVRIVNGVQYISNGIYVNFDTENNIVTSYNLDFTQGEFEDPAKAIGFDAAYNAILEYAPIVSIYIKNDSVYKKVFTLDKQRITVDALSGEIKNKAYETPSFTYSDISGHWAEEPAIKLAEMQIGLPGGKLEPDNAITQEEFLRFATSVVRGDYSGYSTDDFYKAVSDIVKDDEKAPESELKREDAFVFMVRLAGYDQIAKLKDIYKVSYADGAQLTPEKLGYAAILSGLGVICGDGGNLRPQDSLTRAEAIVLVYKYLLSI